MLTLKTFFGHLKDNPPQSFERLWLIILQDRESTFEERNSELPVLNITMGNHRLSMRMVSASSLASEWDMKTPLRTYFERHMALVELDVISSMALGLSLKDLEMI